MTQRVLKFRAWDGKQMYLSPDEIWALGAWFDSHLNTLDKDGVLFQQFTGLRDKNGVEIYEGDILNVCNGSLNGVGWMEKPYAVEYVLNKGFNICMFCWISDGQSRMDSTHWCEVIGNIHENPELLEAK